MGCWTWDGNEVAVDMECGNHPTHELSIRANIARSQAVKMSSTYIRSDSGKEHARLSHLQNRPAELVAHFIDGKLRSGNKGTSEEELEEVLDKTMTLFRYIDGKVRCLFQLDNGCAHNSVARCL